MCVSFFSCGGNNEKNSRKTWCETKSIYIYIYIYIIYVCTKKIHPIKTYVALCWGMAAAMVVVVGPLLLLVLLLCCCCCCFNAVEENPRKGKLRVGTGTCVVLVVAVVLAAVVSVLLLLLIVVVVVVLVVESSVVLRDRLLPVMAFVGDISLVL